jgi:deoxycytidylate deaminase
MGVNHKLVAIVGLCGSGKTIASNFFVSKGYQYLRFGQITLDEVKKRYGLNPPEGFEKAEKEIREGLRKKYGMAAFAILNKPKLDKLLKKGNVVGDGLYSWSEYKYLKQAYGDNFRVIAIQASPEIRYKRLAERKNIDQKLIHRPFSEQEAKQRDYSEIENIEKGGPIAIADVTIINDGTKEEFLEKLEELFKPIKQKRPSWDEYFMSMAVLSSARSSCLHFRVGAIIVLNNHIIGTGYNGAPPGIKKNCLEVGCNKENLGMKNFRQAFDVGKCIGVHAEMNALANLSREIHKGATIYVTIFPCPSCAKNLLAYNISRVVYKREYDPKESRLSRALFKEAGVIVEKLDLTKKQFSDFVFNKTKVDFDIF